MAMRRTRMPRLVTVPCTRSITQPGVQTRVQIYAVQIDHDEQKTIYRYDFFVYTFVFYGPSTAMVIKSQTIKMRNRYYMCQVGRHKESQRKGQDRTEKIKW